MASTENVSTDQKATPEATKTTDQDVKVTKPQHIFDPKLFEDDGVDVGDMDESKMAPGEYIGRLHAKTNCKVFVFSIKSF